MEYISRKKMARAVVGMLSSHSVKEVMTAAAAEVTARRWTREVDGLVQDIAVELWHKEQHALVTIKSARALPAAVLSRIEKMLKERLAAKKMSVDTVVEPTLKGGIVTVTPIGVLDVSIAGRLHQLKQL
jgi:F0F1-type ATP synthase delta subunit